MKVMRPRRPPLPHPMGCLHGGGCRPRGVFTAALLLLGAACLCSTASGGGPPVAGPARARVEVLPATARVAGVRLRKDVPRLAPPAAYYLMVLEVVRPSSGIVTVALDEHIRQETAAWFAARDVRLVHMFAEHIRSLATVHAHRTVTYVLALSANPSVSTLLGYSEFCGYNLAPGAVSGMAAGVRRRPNMGTEVAISAVSSIKAASELQAGGTFDEGGNFTPNRRRRGAGGGGFSNSALIATVCGVLGVLTVVGLSLMLYFRMRGTAAARYSVFTWRGGSGAGGSDRHSSRASRSSLRSSAASTGAGRSEHEWFPSGKRRRSAPSFSASAPAPPEGRGASPAAPPAEDSSWEGGKGGGKGAKGRKAETWDRGDLDDTLRVSVASSSSFNDSAPGSMATPVTPPPRAATMPPVQTRAP